MKYYKAEILVTCENFINNNPEEGCDPCTNTNEMGTQTITASTIDALKDKINKQYDLKLFESFEDRLEYSCEETGNGRTPYFASYSIFLSEVQETKLNANELFKSRITFK